MCARERERERERERKEKEKGEREHVLLEQEVRSDYRR